MDERGPEVKYRSGRVDGTVGPVLTLLSDPSMIRNSEYDWPLLLRKDSKIETRVDRQRL